MSFCPFVPREYDVMPRSSQSCSGDTDVKISESPMRSTSMLPAGSPAMPWTRSSR